MIGNETWLNQNGQLDRGDDLPAHITYDKDGAPYWEEWWSNGVRHRDGGPAIEKHGGPSIEFRKRGRLDVVTFEEWYRHGKLHRENEEPAVTRRTPDGRVIELVYALNGLRHRTGGPAVVKWNEKTGRTVTMEHWHNGQRIPATLHRKKTPSPT